LSWQKRVPRAYTKPEMIVFGILKELGVRFATQERVYTRFREHPFVVDFLLLDDKGVIEVMGRRFHDRTKTQRTKVEVKQACLEGEGYQLLVIWDDELKRKMDRPKVKEKVRKWLEQTRSSVLK